MLPDTSLLAMEPRLPYCAYLFPRQMRGDSDNSTFREYAMAGQDTVNIGSEPYHKSVSQVHNMSLNEDRLHSRPISLPIIFCWSKVGMTRSPTCSSSASVIAVGVVSGRSFDLKTICTFPHSNHFSGSICTRDAIFFHEPWIPSSKHIHVPVIQSDRMDLDKNLSVLEIWQLLFEQFELLRIRLANATVYFARGDHDWTMG